MIGIQLECGGLPPTNQLMMSTINPGTVSSSNSGAMTAPSSTVSTPVHQHHHHNHHSQNGRNGGLNVGGGGGTREKTLQAVEFYNNNVLRARMGAGLAGPRSSVNERHLFNGRSGPTRLFAPTNSDNLYRSNSSLELLHDASPNSHPDGGTSIVHNGNGPVTGLRREYGSHGSIDVISSDRTPTTGESFFAMLQGYRSAVLDVIGTDQRSPGPSEYLKGKSLVERNNGNTDQNPQNGENHHNSSQSSNHHLGDDSVDRGNSSPKLRNKLHRLLAPSKTGRNIQEEFASGPINTSCSVMTTSSADIEERQRRRAFSHYDCQSLTANLGYAAKLRGLLLARRRNTTTGASAASMQSTRSSTPDGTDSGDEDYGDGQTNELVESCPFFRNEVGGEEEREVSLTRMQNPLPPGQQRRAIHRPALACGVSVLECPFGETLWKPTTCPFQKGQRPIESVDSGAEYYRKYFFGQEHQNWFGMDEQLGPVAISIKREKLPTAACAVAPSTDLVQLPTHQIRMIVRTSELLTLRGSVIEDSVPNSRGSKTPSTKDILEYVAPEVQLNTLRLGDSTPQCEQQLLKLDEQGLTNKYKVGILYCRAGQASEEDMYNNEEAGPAFLEFLDTIGKTVRLQGFENYKAGLDNKTDSTGTHSVYATYQGCEVMFHVSTMLPFTPNNRQQLLRKRHIGNDIVTIVFQEPGALPFTPKNIRSQFQHVFVIVRVVNPCSDNTHYRIAVTRSKEVPVFGPPVRINGVYPKGKHFADFLLAKVINAENAAHRSEKFATMATRTRQEYLKDLCSNYCTTTLVDTGTKFSIFPSKKKDRVKPRFCGDKIQRGAFCWQVILHDGGMSSLIECFLGISAETFVLIEECSRQIVFVCPTKAILGWSTSGNSLRIYHHQGECITINKRESVERDEQLEIIERLRAVTPGFGALEFGLRRNNMGQLGFHVQPDGVVTQVEKNGEAYTAGLRQGCRLVEICKVAVATLSHDQMVDLLKTSAQVTVTVIESFPDGNPRRGCLLQNCKFNILNYEDDYESINEKSPSKKTAAQLQQPSAFKKRYERNFSPPRSSNSSGYGTGSSSRSFSVPNDQVRFVSDMGTLTSSSSGHSSDERWYDIAEIPEPQQTPSKHMTQSYQHVKVTHPSNSLPLQSRPLSIHEVGVTSVGVTNGGSSSKMAAVNEVRPLPRQANIESLVPRVPKMQDYVSAESLAKNHHSDGNITDTSSVNNDPIYGSMKSHPTTDDESNDNAIFVRPQPKTNYLKKSHSGNMTVSSSSTSSSRNNSPRPHSEAKLRAGATGRNQNQQRNSVNYTGSTLQEDLIKLINPDYLQSSSDDNFHQGAMNGKVHKGSPNSHSLGNISNISNQLKSTIISDDLLLLKTKSRSREGINISSGQHSSLSNFKIPIKINEKVQQKGNSDLKSDSEVIFTTARPATVISSNSQTSSPAPSEQSTTQKNGNVVLHISEDNSKQQSPRKFTPVLNGNYSRKKSADHYIPQLPLLSDTKEMDWSNLVDTATKAMMQAGVNEGLKKSASAHEFYEELNGHLNAVNITITNAANRASSHQQSHYSSSTPNSTNHSSPTTTLSSNDVHQASSSSSTYSSTSLPELQSHVSQLEDKIMREQRRRRSLEHAVKRLTEENRRLQDESQAAVTQLRRFTEWFFQTIDRQS